MWRRIHSGPAIVEQDLGAAGPYEGDEEPHQTPFGDNNKGDGVFINLRSLLRMPMGKAEAACSAICFESKSRSNQSYDVLVKKVMAIPGNSKKGWAGIKKAIDCSRTLSLSRVQKDFELLVSRYSVENHTSVASWGKFTPNLEDLLNNVAAIIWWL